MKILYVLKTMAQVGGIERVVSDKANYLCDRYGYDVCIITTDQGSHPVPFTLSDRCRIKDLAIRFTDVYKKSGFARLIDQYKRSQLFSQRLKSVIEEEHPDIIIGLADMYADTIAKIKGNIPFIVEAHSSYEHTRVAPKMTFLQKLLRRFYLRHLRKADALVTLTNDDARQWQRWNDNVKVVPNVVHLNVGPSVANAASRKVAFMGRIAYQKGWQMLLDIWQRVVESHADWTLEIWGDGEEREQMLREISSRSIKNIHYNGVTNDALRSYKECSIMVLTSVYEPFGLVLPEAMSCALPVVSFFGQGPCDIITDGVDGYLIPCYDKELFATKLGTLMDDEALRRKMGEGGVASSKRYAAAAIMPQWKQLFEEMVKR